MQARRLCPSILSALALALAAACEGGAPSGVVDSCKGSLGLPPTVATDILFVIDNSGSMEEEQEKVAAQLSTFVETLASSPVENDFQVGVVTTGISVNAESCLSGERRLIEYPDESGRLQLGKDADGNVASDSTRRILGFDDPDLIDQFALLVHQGTTGSGQEMGLEAMRLALSEPLILQQPDAGTPGNAGFLRPGARLLVVIVSDEDDCSDPEKTTLTLVTSDAQCRGSACMSDSECDGAGQYCLPNDDDPTTRSCEENACETPEGRAKLEPVETYVDFLNNLDDGTGTGRRRDVSLAVIGAVDTSGKPERCSSDTDEAQGVGERYAKAVELMGDHGFIDSICRDDYAETLEKIAKLVNAPQVIELPASPPDGRLIVVTLRRDGQAPISCRVDDGFQFEPAVGDAPARLVMEDQCRLRSNDTLEVAFVCAS